MTQRTSAEDGTNARSSIRTGDSSAADDRGATAKFSVRSWKKVKLKCRVIERFRGAYTVEEMCRVFGGSRSGYYSWRIRQNKMPKDQRLVDLIIECQQKCNQTYGCRRVKRRLARFKGKRVNMKDILRITRKLDVLSQIRRRMPYTRCKQGSFKYNNLLNRQVLQKQPNKFWVTDITYIHIPGRMLYMCAVLDLGGCTVFVCTGNIIPPKPKLNNGLERMSISTTMNGLT